MRIFKLWARLSSVAWLAQNCKTNWLRYLVCMTILKLRRRIRGGGFLATTAEDMYLSLLSDAGHKPERAIEFYVQELLEWRELRDFWERRTREQITPHQIRAWELKEEISYWQQVIVRRIPLVVLYALARELKPKVIVETGTSYGGST